MKHYGLLGEHLSHSYSKIIHEYIFNNLNIDADYSLIECDINQLGYYIDELKKGKYAGFNVTIPYKKEIIKYLDILDDKALKIGSVNTIYVKNDKVIGSNTDYDGFLETIRINNIDVLNKECYILGTGGASLAINAVLKDLGGNCYFVSRNPKLNQKGYNELENSKIDILVNTTPIGMYPNINECLIDKKILEKINVVIDIIFNPKKTKLLEYASSSINGITMLIYQAIKAEEIWQNKTINIDINELEKMI